MRHRYFFTPLVVFLVVTVAIPLIPPAAAAIHHQEFGNGFVSMEYPSAAIQVGERFWVTITGSSTASVSPTVTAYSNGSMEVTGCRKVAFLADSFNAATKSARWQLEMDGPVCSWVILTSMTGAQARSAATVMVPTEKAIPMALLVLVVWLAYAYFSFKAPGEFGILLSVAALFVWFVPVAGPIPKLLALAQVAIIATMIHKFKKK